MLSFLLDGIDHASAEIRPVDRTIGDGDQLHAGLTEGMNPVTGFDAVEPAKTVLVPHDDCLKRLARCVANHLLELETLLGSVPANPFVDILTNDSVPVLQTINFFVRREDFLGQKFLGHKKPRKDTKRMFLIVVDFLCLFATFCGSLLIEFWFRLRRARFLGVLLDSGPLLSDGRILLVRGHSVVRNRRNPSLRHVTSPFH